MAGLRDRSKARFVFTQLTIFTLRADNVVYDVGAERLKRRANVVIEKLHDGGLTQRAKSMKF